MTAIASDSRQSVDRAASTSPNPYLVALVSFALFAGLLAFMLEIALIGITDFATYDVDVAGGLVFWIYALVLSGAAAITGAAVIARTRRRSRLAQQS